MSQESVSLSAETVQQQTRPEPVEHKMVDSDDHEGSSHKAEQFGIGLSVGMLLGAIVGVVTNSLGLSVFAGLMAGVVLGIYMMERR